MSSNSNSIPLQPTTQPSHSNLEAQQTNSRSGYVTTYMSNSSCTPSVAAGLGCVATAVVVGTTIIARCNNGHCH